jgi:hypothetical protein
MSLYFEGKFQSRKSDEGSPPEDNVVTLSRGIIDAVKVTKVGGFTHEG